VTEPDRRGTNSRRPLACHSPGSGHARRVVAPWYSRARRKRAARARRATSSSACRQGFARCPSVIAERLPICAFRGSERHERYLDRDQRLACCGTRSRLPTPIRPPTDVAQLPSRRADRDRVRSCAGPLVGREELTRPEIQQRGARVSENMNQANLSLSSRLVSYFPAPYGRGRASRTLALRAAVGGVFLASGVIKFLFANQAAGRFAKIGLPAPERSSRASSAPSRVVGGALLVQSASSRGWRRFRSSSTWWSRVGRRKVPLLFGSGAPSRSALCRRSASGHYAYRRRLDVAMLVAAGYLLAVGAGLWSIDGVLVAASLVPLATPQGPSRSARGAVAGRSGRRRLEDRESRIEATWRSNRHPRSKSDTLRPETDEALVAPARAPRRERPARPFTPATAPLVFSVAARIVDASAAEEAVQDVFVTVWRQGGDVRLPQRGPSKVGFLQSHPPSRLERSFASAVSGGGERQSHLAEIADEKAMARRGPVAAHRRAALQRGGRTLSPLRRGKRCRSRSSRSLTHEQVAAALQNALGDCEDADPHRD